MRGWKRWDGARKMILARSRSPTKAVLEELIEVAEEKRDCETDQMKMQEKMLVSFWSMGASNGPSRSAY